MTERWALKSMDLALCMAYGRLIEKHVLRILNTTRTIANTLEMEKDVWFPDERVYVSLRNADDDN